MKVEPRGKYGGVKVHLDSEEVISFMEALPTAAFDHTHQDSVIPTLLYDLFKHTKKLLAETPDLLVDKPPDKVAEVLQYEAEKAAAKLAKLTKGEDWTKVKPEGWKAPGVKV